MKTEIFIDIKIAAVKGGKALFFRHLTGFLINFFGGIILARILGPQILGLYFISYTLLLILRGLVDFGIKTHFIRLPLNPSLEEIQTAFTLQQILGLISALLIGTTISPFLVSWYGHEELFILAVSAGIGAYFYGWQSIPLSLLERKIEYKKVGIIEVADNLFFNIAAVMGA
ncbi:MAG: oligosaccharide flippase family protein, partial [Thermodesulfobacteriota bacterium]|nr:oligosaccharide flippase family protein [Thermodesulfobacteriota bacterium]